MEKIDGTWGQVQQFAYVRDLNGTTWRVDYIDAARVTLVNVQDQTVIIERPVDDRPVTIFVPTEGEAKQIITKALGAKVIAVYHTP